MTIKEQIKNILLNNFHSVYCDTCKFPNTNICDECHRKYINWSLSPEIADKISEEIVAILLFQKNKYAYCDAYCLDFGVPRCLGTKEMDVCTCEGNKYQCDFYDYSK